MPAADAPESTALTVSLVRPGGPADEAGLKVGDVITAVGDHDVGAERRYLFGALSTVSPGTTLEVGLHDGRRLAIVAGRP